MIHQPNFNSPGGPVSNVVNDSRLAEIYKHELIELLAANTNIAPDELEKILVRPFYLSALNSNRLGIIDKVDVPVRTPAPMQKLPIPSDIMKQSYVP